MKKTTSEERFDEFTDWLKTTNLQEEIVEANVALLLDREKWKAKVVRFEKAIAFIEDDEEKKEKRAEYIIHFNGATFPDGKKNFVYFTFPCSVDFSGTIFGEGNVDFTDAKFGEGYAFFFGTKFGEGYVFFSGTKFGEGDVDFSRARFGEGDVNFSRAEFSEGNVDFMGTIFGNGSVNFNGTQFGEGHVSFYDAEFGEGNVNFSRARFGKGGVSFSPAKMESTTLNAPDMVVEGNFYFKPVHIKSASFERLKVSETASFSGTKFDEVPDFRDAKFDRAPEVAAMIVPRPIMKPKEKWWHFSLAKNEDDVAKYRKLKAMALAANDHEKDGEFFSYEMMAKRGHETKSTGGLLFSTLYWVLSEYGQSFMRPLKAMWYSFLGGWFIYGAIFQCYFPLALRADRTEVALFSAIHSLRNTAPLLGTFFRFAVRPDGQKSYYETAYENLTKGSGAFEWLYWGGVIQSIFGAVLLFLFLLALRNKFRLK